MIAFCFTQQNTLLFFGTTFCPFSDLRVRTISFLEQHALPIQTENSFRFSVLFIQKVKKEEESVSRNMQPNCNPVIPT